MEVSEACKIQVPLEETPVIYYNTLIDAGGDWHDATDAGDP